MTSLAVLANLLLALLAISPAAEAQSPHEARLATVRAEGDRLRAEALPVGRAIQRAGLLVRETVRSLRSSGVATPHLVLGDVTDASEPGSIRRLVISTDDPTLSSYRLVDGDPSPVGAHGSLCRLRTGLLSKRWAEAVGRSAITVIPDLTAQQIDDRAATWVAEIETTALATRR